MNKKFYIFLFLVFGYTVPAFSTPINLNNFNADSTVTVSADGSSAIMEEDPALMAVLLYNDPSPPVGDPSVIIPNVGTSLLFEYSFVEPTDNVDAFYAFIWDVDAGTPAGIRDDFITQETSSGTVEFDLSPFVGQTLGLEFQLLAHVSDPLFSSTVEIWDVRLSKIPEPSPMMLMGIGLLFIAGVSRRQE